MPFDVLRALVWRSQRKPKLRLILHTPESVLAAVRRMIALVSSWQPSCEAATKRLDISCKRSTPIQVPED